MQNPSLIEIGILNLQKSFNKLFFTSEELKNVLRHLQISQIEKVKWIRFLYSYPETLTDELIEEVKTNDKVCKYFDIPIQHISDEMLKKMNRKTTKKSIEETIKKIRKEIPDAIIRSTVMVGFPGETKEQFEKLEEFVKETKFDKLGCFAYSKEDGTPASKMDEQVHHMTKKSRYNKIMKLQEEISAEKLSKFVGKTFDVLVEADGVGRTYMDVPEIDGVILFKGKADLGTFVKCKVTGSKEYDLIGEIIK